MESEFFKTMYMRDADRNPAATIRFKLIQNEDTNELLIGFAWWNPKDMLTKEAGRELADARIKMVDDLIDVTADKDDIPTYLEGTKFYAGFIRPMYMYVNLDSPDAKEYANTKFEDITGETLDHIFGWAKRVPSARNVPEVEDGEFTEECADCTANCKYAGKVYEDRSGILDATRFIKSMPLDGVPVGVFPTSVHPTAKSFLEYLAAMGYVRVH